MKICSGLMLINYVSHCRRQRMAAAAQRALAHTHTTHNIILLLQKELIQVYVRDLDSQCICETVSCILFFSVVVSLFFVFFSFLIPFLPLDLSTCACECVSALSLSLIVCMVVLILCSAFAIIFYNMQFNHL